VTATTNHRHGLTDEVRSRVKCAVRLTDDDGTHAGDNPWLSLNGGLPELTRDDGTGPKCK